jgi:hypothetical protein
MLISRRTLRFLHLLQELAGLALGPHFRFEMPWSSNGQNP